MPQKKRCKKKIKIPGIVTIDFYFYWGVLEQLGECCSLNHCSCWEILVALGKSCAWKRGMKKTMLFAFQNKRRNTGSCAMRQVRDLLREVFWLLQFRVLSFVCCYFCLSNGEALISSRPTLWFWLVSSQGTC